MRKLTFSLLLIIPNSLLAQFVYQYDHSIPVEVKGKKLLNPWSGGLNSIQYNTLDLNLDGTDDLVLFDRTANKISTFLAINKQYKYAPQYESYFPKSLTNWMILRDFDCDGKKDIFESTPAGIRIHKNITTGNTPKWKVAIEVVTTLGISHKINLKINGGDIPAIEDIDGDGDLDILTFGFVGDGGIQYHKNFSKERTGNCGMDMERQTTNWGNFKECNCGVFAFDGDPCPPSGGRVQHIGGKSLMAYDRDGDGDMEIVVGEESCNTLYILENEGNATNADMNSASVFQENDRPARINVYPAAFREDINFDGIKDLLVSLCLTFSVIDDPSDFSKSSMSYYNQGNRTVPNFVFQQDNFLQSETIDHGIDSSVAFYDIDGDGDLDMLITSHGSFHANGAKYASSIALYLNVGSKSQPSFKQEDSDYLGFSDQNFLGMNIQLADMNNDGKMDLIIRAHRKNTGKFIFYLINKANIGLGFQTSSRQFIGMRFSSIENLFFYDIDGDNDLDIISGNSNGNLILYRNEGNPHLPKYVKETEKFYGKGISFTHRNIIPTVADLNGDGKVELITTDNRGGLTIYDNFIDKIDAPEPGITTTYYNPFDKKATHFKLGIKSKPVAVDLDNSGTPYIVLSTIGGGLQVLKNTNAKPPIIDPNSSKMTIFLNPSFGNNEFLAIQVTEPLKISIFSILGKKIIDGVQALPSTPLRITTSGLGLGMYVAVAFRNGEVVEQNKFVISR